VLIFVYSGGIPTRGQGVRCVGIFIGTNCEFHFNEIDIEMRLGPHGNVDGICGIFVGVPHPHKGSKYLN
jgi:hypothetical protein